MGARSKFLARRSQRRSAVAGACTLAAALLAGCGAAPDSAAGSTGGGKQDQYKIYVTTNFTGNAFREQIVRTMEFAAKNGPLADRISEFEVVTSGASVQEQTQALDNIARQKPDAIIVQAASTTGVNAAIERACKAGIVVVSFDSTATAPCNYQFTFDRKQATENLGKMLVASLGGESGTFLVDRAIPGQSVADESRAGYLAAVESAPNLEAVEFQGELNPGVTKSAVANILPANRDVKGIGLIAFSPQVQQAVAEAGLGPVAVGSLAAFNEDTLLCAQDAFPCFYAATPPAFGAEAMKFAIDLMDGKEDRDQKLVNVDIQYLSNVATEVPGSPEIEVSPFEVGVNAYPDLPPTLAFPLGPDWLDITPQQAAGQ